MLLFKTVKKLKNDNEKNSKTFFLKMLFYRDLK